ncbi:MAG: hypothetical protein PWQ67_2333 [Clostridia bacterium]|jgi:uncharacterized protein YrrD|nr:hypothetical protein [Clostridia bacterium]MDN5323879.1 hypothetical protein [Clostridia bacterium]
MSDNTTRVQSLLGKEVVNLKDGSFIGKIQSVVINPVEKKVIGVYVKLKGILSGRNFIPFSGIQSFGTHSVTIKEDFDPEATAKGVEEKDIINMPVITITGTMLGKVDSFTFEKSSGVITEYILTEGIVQDTLRGKALLKGEKVSRIGKDVLIAAAEVDETGLEELDNHEYEESVVSTFIEVKEDAQEVYDESKEKLQETKENIVEEIETSKISAKNAWQQAISKAKKISEEWTFKIKEQAGKVEGEAKELWTEAQSVTQKQIEKLNHIKEKWQEKLANIQNKKQDEFGEQLLNEIKGKTVSKTLYDDEGNAIILPGQVINDEIFKKAGEKGKLHELFILAATKEVEDQIEEMEN